jgi:hypothetical protein
MKPVLFILLLLSVYFIGTHLFALKTITVVGNNIQVQIDQKRFPKSLLFFPADKLRAEILSDNPILTDVRFQKNYPNTLVIIPTLRTAAALLVTADRRVLIDNRGIVLSDADTLPAGMPVLYKTVSGIHVGLQISDQGVQEALAVIAGDHPAISIETITIEDDGVVRAHTRNLDILFTQNADIPNTLTTLQTLMTGFRIKGTLPKVIDLRFDKPVITF